MNVRKEITRLENDAGTLRRQANEMAIVARRFRGKDTAVFYLMRVLEARQRELALELDNLAAYFRGRLEQ